MANNNKKGSSSQQKIANYSNKRKNPAIQEQKLSDSFDVSDDDSDKISQQQTLKKKVKESTNDPKGVEILNSASVNSGFKYSKEGFDFEAWQNKKNILNRIQPFIQNAKLLFVNKSKFQSRNSKMQECMNIGFTIGKDSDGNYAYVNQNDKLIVIKPEAHSDLMELENILN